MPLYTYECKTCGEATDHTFKIAEKPDTVPCPKCQGVAVKVLSVGIVLGDEMPAWMRHPEVLGCLQSQGDKNRIRTRSDYKAYLKRNNIAELSAGREI